MRPARTEDERARFEGIRLVFADSIAPIASAGQLRTWTGSYQVDGRLRLEPAPGHTPGSSVAWLGDNNAAVFAGDLVHTPIQLLRASDSCAFDLDADEAGRSRRAVLTAAARARATVLPAHFAGQGAVTLTVGDDDEPALGRWAEFPAI
jgi:glyoxylase-like metal-dependent hydrolase (beta-lactamase superfamily II)